MDTSSRSCLHRGHAQAAACIVFRLQTTHTHTYTLSHTDTQANDRELTQLLASCLAPTDLIQHPAANLSTQKNCIDCSH
jgi:hypothetical protein